MTLATPTHVETESARSDSVQRLVPHHGQKHLDLFSGIGGFALAAQRTGWQTIGFSEIEPYACKILKRHWPDVPNHGDIRTIRGVRCDLITGGFPCQPFSLAGKRAGASDDRALWPEMLRVIDEAKPRWVLGENVAGIITLELDRVLADLEALGYAAWPLVVPACAVDARHRRDRVWIVAHSESNDRWCGLRKTRTEQNGNQPSNSGAPLADADETGRREQCRAEPMGTEHAVVECGGEDVGQSDSDRRKARMAEGWAGTPIQPDSAIARGECCVWQPEPEVGRVAHGIPARSHRLRGLGNAIVPQVAEAILCQIARVMGNAKLRDAGESGVEQH